MPELPEVETIRRGILGLSDKKIKEIAVFYDNIVKNETKYFKDIVLDAKITNVSRRGKYLCLSISKNQKSYNIIVHLRMTGQLYYFKKDHDQEQIEKIADKHLHLKMVFSDESFILYRDIRKFGKWELIDISFAEYIKSKKLGEDALDITLAEFKEKLKNRKKVIKALLLDQSIIAGIGNIYADESLFRAKIKPQRTNLSQKEIKVLLEQVKITLRAAILKGGTSFSDYVNSFGQKGKFQLELKVYQRESQKCPDCDGIISRTKVASRSTFYCKNCQK